MFECFISNLKPVKISKVYKIGIPVIIISSMGGHLFPYKYIILHIIFVEEQTNL